MSMARHPRHSLSLSSPATAAVAHAAGVWLYAGGARQPSRATSGRPAIDETCWQAGIGRAMQTKRAGARRNNERFVR